MRDCRAPKVLKEFRGYRDFKDYKDFKGGKDHREYKGRKLALKDIRVSRDYRAT
jgi:hypothetical protein